MIGWFDSSKGNLDYKMLRLWVEAKMCLYCVFYLYFLALATKIFQDLPAANLLREKPYGI